MKGYLLGKEAAREKPAGEERASAEGRPDEVAEADAPLMVAARTDVGRVRSTNQDALIEAEEDLLWGVADGMGGHKGGEIASAGARDGLTAALHGKDPSPETLKEAIVEVNRQLFFRQQDDESLSGMGTTLTVLWLGDHRVYVGHVGDSRAYLLRDGELRQVTNDHSLVAELYRLGQLTREQAENHPMRNVITRAVGTEEGIEVELLTEERRPGDVWLVCSDGLHGMVSDERLRAVLTANAPRDAADALMTAALKAGGRDNVSLVVLLDKEGGE